jgi:hypothetical protein
MEEHPGGREDDAQERELEGEHPTPGRHNSNDPPAASETGARFLSRRMIGGLAFYLLFVVTFASFRVNNDGLVYYNFLRRFLGEDVPAAHSREFGAALFNVPFYAVAKGFQKLTPLHSAFGAPLGQVSITVASTAAVLVTLYLGWRILGELELPNGPAVLLITLFGSPLFYYAVFQPSYKHAVDVLFATLFAFLLLRATEGADRRLLLALGACLGVMVTIRYVNVAFFAGVLTAFLVRRQPRAAGTVALAMLVTALAVVSLPGLRGIRYSQPPQSAAVAAPLEAGLLPNRLEHPCREVYLAHRLSLTQCLRNRLGVEVAPRVPVLMLVSVRRGLFLWTPLTLVAAFGFALLYRRRPDRRAFLAGMLAATAALVLIHGIWGGFWWGGFSFSQRFLCALFPFFLLGVAEIVRRFGRAGWAVLAVCAVFSIFVAFNLYVGYKGESERDGIDTIVRLYTSGERTPPQLIRLIGRHAWARWH